MPKIRHHAAAITITFGLIVAFFYGAPVASADPGTGSPNPGNTGQTATIGGGAPIEKLGTGSPDFSTPIPVPANGTDEEKAAAKAQERARQEAQKARIAGQAVQNTDGYQFCVEHPHDEVCPKER